MGLISIMPWKPSRAELYSDKGSLGRRVVLELRAAGRVPNYNNSTVSSQDRGKQ
jgi:hypothetical protein